VDDAELAGNTAQVQAIDGEAHRLAAQRLAIALGLALGGVAPSAGLAQVALAARRIAASLDLTVRPGTEGASDHAGSLLNPPGHVYPFSHSLEVRHLKHKH